MTSSTFVVLLKLSSFLDGKKFVLFFDFEILAQLRLLLLFERVSVVALGCHELVSLMLVEFSSLLLIVEVALSSHIAVFLFLLLIDFSQALLFSDRLDGLLPDILAYIHAFLLLMLMALLVLHRLHLEHVILL